MLSRLPEEGLLEAENWFFMRLEKGDSSGEVSFVDSCFSLPVLISCLFLLVELSSIFSSRVSFLSSVFLA